MRYQLADEAPRPSPPGEKPLQSDDQISPFKTQLLKWIGNKQKFAHEIISFFPEQFADYHEPFLGSGGVMATLAPRRGFGSDCFEPLIEIWKTLVSDRDKVKTWYRERWEIYHSGDRAEQYEKIKARYNAGPNGADLLFLCRACYGGVVRFRKKDGYMSTPVGAHSPMRPDTFDSRVNQWSERLSGCSFDHLDYRQALTRAKPGDLVYCDPPYSFSQAILYGAQSFQLEELLIEIQRCKSRGVFVALSIDGTKKSGDTLCDIPFPPGLFEREAMVNVGRSMLRRFQMGGQSLEQEVVRDRLMLTY